MIATAADELRWDLTPFFPSIDSQEFVDSFNKFSASVARFEDTVATKCQGETHFETILSELNDLLEEAHFLGSYIYALFTTDTNDEEAQARVSEYDSLTSRIGGAQAILSAWVGTLDIEKLISTTDAGKAHAFFLRKLYAQSAHLMSPAEEALAAKLQTTGSSSWSKLHGSFTSQIVVDVDGKDMPMSAARALAYDPDRDVRRSAYEAELMAWKANEIPCAAAMNAIKGEVGLLASLRGWGSGLDTSLFSSNIDRATLDAMLSAAREFFPDFRRYLRAKAKLLGQSQLPWFDLFAPVGNSTRRWSYSAACEFVEQQFRSYSDKMGDLAARSQRERWVDVEPRPAKVDGAYCTGMHTDVSRIMMNFKPSFGSVTTLAHELGHAYHNLCLNGRTELQRETPMTLAETASIFCETILKRAALKEISAEEKLPILEATLVGQCQTVVDISSRYLFESAVFERRTARDLSPSEMCQIMREAQLDTYGDGLDPEFLHPYMWAAKPHYYSGNESFYNYPYMFGCLFSLGLFAVFEREPGTFKGRYDELLSSTGLADAATLADGFGIDIRTKDFWRASLSVIKSDIGEFVALVG